MTGMIISYMVPKGQDSAKPRHQPVVVPNEVEPAAQTTEVNKSSSFHLLEIHMPSAGTSAVTLIIVAAVAFCLYILLLQVTVPLHATGGNPGGGAGDGGGRPSTAAPAPLATPPTVIRASRPTYVAVSGIFGACLTRPRTALGHLHSQRPNWTDAGSHAAPLQALNFAGPLNTSVLASFTDGRSYASVASVATSCVSACSHPALKGEL